MTREGEDGWRLCEDLATRARKGLLERPPELIEEGEGGTYLIRDSSGEMLAVFKPSDEEPFSVANPKNAMPGTPQPSRNNPEIKKGIRPGEAAVREVAAYLLDHGHKAGVPLTALVELSHPMFGPHPKTGSLQQFVVHECGSWDLGASQYEPRDVHRIGVLDLRLFNVDRHGGNILVQRKSTSGGRSTYRLVPIDHGFTLPDSVNAVDLWFEWMSWPQAKIPFDDDVRSYIATLNVDHDARILRALGVRDECIRSCMLSTVLLKKAAMRGMTLSEIGALVCRSRDAVRPTMLETVAQNQLLKDTRAKYFLQNLETTVEEALDRPKRDRKHRPGFQQKHTRNLSAVGGPLRRASSALVDTPPDGVPNPYLLFASETSLRVPDDPLFIRRNLSQESLTVAPAFLFT
jgi:hypothetical protein